MTDQSLPDAGTVAGVVHSFTQAELALVEVTSAVAKFRAASEQLASSQADVTAAVAALDASTDASTSVAHQLEAVASLLGEAVTALRAIDPDRLWAHLEAVDQRSAQLEQQRAADHAASLGTTQLALRVSAIAAVLAGIGGLFVVLFGLRILGN